MGQVDIPYQSFCQAIQAYQASLCQALSSIHPSSGRMTCGGNQAITFPWHRHVVHSSQAFPQKYQHHNNIQLHSQQKLLL
jgi:hypothetical protein